MYKIVIMKIERLIYKQLLKEYERPEVSILLGPRQVGKTFLLKELDAEFQEMGLRTHFYNLEIPSDTVLFNRPDEELFEMLTANVDVVFIDEFHYLKNASRLFKAIYDSDRKVKIYASGSSSIEIHKHLRESLAGRRLVTKVYPLSLEEYLQTGETSPLESYLCYGGLPGIIHYQDYGEKIRILNELLETYIQKDIKSLIKEENIRAFNSLLYLLAENQGSVLSASSLASDVGLTSKSITHHVSILENTYVLYPLYSYSKNLGNELKKSKKYYLYDTGIRNALLKDFSSLEERQDTGILYEMFVMIELVKQLKPNMELKFWRTKQGDEIDFILLCNRKPYLLEVKTSHREGEIPSGMKKFIEKYPETAGAVVFSKDQYSDVMYMGKKISYLKHEDVMDYVSRIQ